MGWNCIAAWEKGVLQYCLLADNCIAIQLCQAGLRRQGLFRNTVQSIVTEAAGLCRDTGSRHSRAGPRHSRRGAQARRWGAGRSGRAGAGELWERRGGSGEQGARGSGKQGARGRGAAWALGSRPGRAGWPRAMHLVHSACFWPDLVPESNFWTLFANSVHEHCSSQIFFGKKKNIF